MTTTLVILALLAALVIAAPFVMAARRTDPDTALAPGKFSDLSQGRTHYLWYGGARGPVAVCIHGLTTPSPVWDGLVPELLSLGYRVLVYDLYGRGYSDTAPGRQDEAFFLTQLEDLLADQNLAEDLTVIGYSMGGSIATAFAAKNPHMVQRVVLIAPAGIHHDESRFYRFVRRTPLVGDWLHGLLEPLRMRREIDREPQDEWPEILDARRQSLTRSGFFRAVLSSRRGILGGTQEAAHREITRQGIEVLAVFGERDEVIPIRAMGLLTQWNRTARQEMIDGAGHDLVYAHGERVGGIIRDFVTHR